MESAHRRWLTSGGRASPQPFPALAAPTHSSLSIRSTAGRILFVNKRRYSANNGTEFSETQEMNGAEKMTGRGAIVLAMAVIILSVTGAASAWCVVERGILVFCYA